MSERVTQHGYYWLHLTDEASQLGEGRHLPDGTARKLSEADSGVDLAAASDGRCKMRNLRP